jgi:DNA-binding IclR family transcriptional regulator
MAYAFHAEYEATDGVTIRAGKMGLAGKWQRIQKATASVTCDPRIFDRGAVLYVKVLHSEHTLTIAARVGRRLPVYCTASGRAFLALLPPEVAEPILDAPLKPCTPGTITSSAKLRDELEATHQRGYALDDEEFEEGIRAVFAPFRDIDGHVIAALSMPGPLDRCHRSACARLPVRLWRPPTQSQRTCYGHSL